MSVNMGCLRCERAGDVPDVPNAAIRGGDYLDHIKTPRHGFGDTANEVVLVGHVDNFGLFALINRGQRSLHLFRRSRAHFNEDDGALVTGDDIELALLSTKIRLDQRQALGAQQARCMSLAQRTQLRPR